MANEEHLNILKQGAEVWNNWRGNNLNIELDLSRAKLSGTDISGANLNKANLSGTNLSRAQLVRSYLSWANLIRALISEADLEEADLRGANLKYANLKNANLRDADLSGADLSETDLCGANLSKANLNKAILVETNLKKANLSGSSIYGISAWNLNLEDTIQSNLIISEKNKHVITIDNLEVAQFVYLLINNEKIRNVIDTITSKVVLILGRFIKEKKAILDVIREEIRKRNYLPVLFDFEGPSSRDITETISILAHLARFIIADITDAKSIPQELKAIVPNLPSVAVQPLLQNGKDEYGMFEHFKRYPWVLPIHRYKEADNLIETIEEKVIAPAEAKVLEIRRL